MGNIPDFDRGDRTLTRGDREFIELVSARAASIVISTLMRLLGGYPEVTDEEVMEGAEKIAEFIRTGSRP